MDLSRNISGLIERQLPEFVNADYPKFRTFLELYYKWLEDPNGGATVYNILNAEYYRDVDNASDQFILLLKNELLPYFPEKSALDLVKILKGAREFYAKKGSEESVKWLFRVLFDQEVEVFYPKRQILKASDGKWKLPLAFRLTLSTENEDINPNDLERLKGEGSISTATCVIESANKTVDKNFGNEVLEIYVSNVEKEFVNGEFLVIKGVPGYSNTAPFSEKIIGAISNIRVDSNINTDPQQKRRGLLYNVGDPVIVFGGLDNTPEARDAVAYVEDVSQGSIEGIAISFPGYGYRIHPKAISTVLRSVGDDPNANLSTSIKLTAINTTNVAGSSQETFVEYVSLDKMPIEYLKSTTIGSGGSGGGDYPLFTQNNRNILITIQDNDTSTLYAGDYVYANGVSLATANFVGRVLNTTSLTPGSCTNVILYSVSNTKPLTDSGFLIGTNKLFSPNNLFVCNVTSVISPQILANANSKIIQTLNYDTIETGGALLFTIENGGYGFRTTPRIVVETFHDTFWSEAELVGSTIDDADYKATRQNIKNYGRISHIYINTGGTGYTNGDSIIVSGRGYGFVGNVVVGAGGTIVSTNIIDRGEGYYEDKTVTVSGSGSGAVLTAYEFSEGAAYTVQTGAIGRVRSIKVTNRGFDYISAPQVSLKVMDMVVVAIPEEERFKVVEGNYIYQGDISEPTFTSIVKNYTPSNNLLRTFNYSGTFDPYANIRVFKRTVLDGINIDEDIGPISINLLESVPVPSPLYPVGITLGNPMFYGNGRAKAVADFFNGLIKFNGFYLNSDGFLSADKKTQDSKTYHNFSYVIQSEKSLSEFEGVIKDIVHPVGTTMLSKTITYNQTSSDVKEDSFVYIKPPIDASSNVQISNSYSNVITGNGTSFTASLVGNLINLIDYSNPQRSFVKLVTNRNSATSINVEGNFIKSGEGYISTSTQNVYDSGIVASISGRYSPGTGYIRYSDLNRKVFIANTLLSGTANVNNVTTTVIGSGTDFSNTLSVGNLVIIDNQIKSIVTVTDPITLTVNSIFTSNTSNNGIYKLSGNLKTFVVGSSIYSDGQERVVTDVFNPEYMLVDSAFNSKSDYSEFYYVDKSPAAANVTRTSGSAVTTIKPNDIIKVNNEIRLVLNNDGSNKIITNAPFSYAATAQTVYKLYDTTYIVSSNTNPISDFIAPGDDIAFNVAPYNNFIVGTNKTATAYMLANTVAGSNIANGATSIVLSSNNITVGAVVKINNEIRKVTFSNATAFRTNTAFNYTNVNEPLYILVTRVVANVSEIVNSNYLLSNVTNHIAQISNAVYYTIPDYTTRDYTYQIINVLE